MPAFLFYHTIKMGYNSLLFFRGKAGKGRLYLSRLPGEQLVPHGFWIDGHRLSGHIQGLLCHEDSGFERFDGCNSFKTVLYPL